MATLTGQTIASSYEQLLHVDTDGGGNTTTLVPVKDGDNGTTFAMQLSTTTVCIDNPTADSSTQGGILRLQSDDGALMQSGSRLGVIEFAGAEDSSSTITVGGRIESVTDAAWSASENGADMVFYTTDGNASQSEVMRLTADGIGVISNATSAPCLIVGSSDIDDSTDGWGGMLFGRAETTATYNKAGIFFQRDGSDGHLRGDLIFAVDGGADSGNATITDAVMKLDANSRISLSNNDSGGTGGEDSTSGNTLFGYLSGAAIESGGLNNTTIGHKAGNAISTADNNVFIGALAGSTHLTGGRNTAIGTQAMFNTDEDSDSNSSISNVFIGAQAGGGTWAGETSNHNIGIGDLALGGALAGGDGTVAIGGNALVALTSGERNVAIGFDVAKTGTTAANNVFIGHLVGDAMGVDGTGNVAIGRNAYGGSHTGSVHYVTAVGESALAGALTTGAAGTVAIGQLALTALTSGAGNVAVGYQALDAQVTGDNNTAIGYSALGANAVADGAGNNTAIGFDAAKLLVTGVDNVVIGSAALDAADGTESYNVAIGSGAMGAVDEGGGAANQNVCIGRNAGLGGASTEFSNNTAIGYGAFDGSSSQLISNVVAIGHEALSGAVEDEAAGTVAVGKSALTALTTGARNLAIGYQALEDSTIGDDNVAVGYLAMNGASTTDGVDRNVAVGNYTLDAIADNAAENNVAIGHNSGTGLTSGDDNTMIGNATAANLRDGSDNVIIGSGADVDANARGGCVIIGTGLSLNTASDNVVEIGNDTNSMTYDLDGGDITVTSDVRTKKDIKDSKLGLEFINRLRPITYKTKPSSQYPKEFDVKQPSKKSSNKVWDGLIAQEVKEVMDEMEVGFSGWEEGINTKQRLAYGKFVMPLIKAVQELTAKVEALEAK